jgi:hypothetical protein
MNSHDEVVAAIRRANVQLDWRRFLAEQWPITLRMIGSQTELRALFIAWYLSPNDHELLWCDEHARPIRAGEASAKLYSAEWQPHRLPAVIRYGTAFSAPGVLPVRIVIPAYQLPGEETLLLDGAHRSVALATFNVRFEVTLAVIHGPIEEAALRDLRHWQ